MLRTPVVSQGHSRHKIGSARRDQKIFTRTGSMTHNLNLRKLPMRGGYRL